ncbi:MAG: hypothetical protein A3D44_01085 [Candidatus Staskawiczbacteria bacterium RIFCSPHIGHO2_02_FULL_42_22]|uniref:Uncharacterized protein n=1 Tax=Candidatus Staskawiczbacteria bacterium RIFCSPHIGHO2_02_FULL_42_22 TaxID=1802207 RepID=A0A1G2I3N5_9BACT|nr:MAG: hypothetical protein A3D44_01085 [Candidatus Staskawiczbacteria bacterium RIFCSPHIGHO2_02_FULL_42_22]
MLNLLVNLPETVTQVLVMGEKATPLMRSISYIQRVSTDRAGMWTLWLYQRHNSRGPREVGVVYEGGPNYTGPGVFPGEMLSFFQGAKSVMRQHCRTTKNS